MNINAIGTMVLSVMLGVAGNAFAWSAIAVDMTKRHAPYGFVVNLPTKEKAEIAAMANCGGSNCKLLYSGDQKGWMMLYSSKPLHMDETGPVSFGYCAGAKDSQSAGNCADTRCYASAKSVNGRPCGSGPFAKETYGDGSKEGSKKKTAAKQPADINKHLSTVNTYLNNFYPVPNWDGSSNTQNKVDVTKSSITVTKSGPYGASSDTYKIADIEPSSFEFRNNIGSNEYARRIAFKFMNASGQAQYSEFDIPRNTSDSMGKGLTDALREIAVASKPAIPNPDGLTGEGISGSPLEPTI